MKFNEEFKAIKARFMELQENDPIGAFVLCRDSASLQSSIEEDLATWNKWLAEAEFDSDTILARQSMATGEKSVASADRIAKVTPEYLTQKAKAIETKCVVDILKSQIRALEKYYFTSKDMYDRANKVGHR